MPTQLLSVAFVETLRAQGPPARNVSWFDTEISGFMLEQRISGAATWYFRYRDAGGRIRMCRIGRCPEVAPGEARTKAWQMRQELDAGGDPKLNAQRFARAPTLEEFVRDKYLPYARTRKRSWTTDEVLLRRHLLPAFGSVRMNHVRRADVTAFHLEAIRKGYAPGTCNRLLILLKFVYNCAIRWEVLPADMNPCVGVEPVRDNGARERYLSAAEVQRLFDELDQNRNVQVGQVIRLLLYTGARKREVLDARWEHIDLERRSLLVPLSKSGRPRHIPLSDAAVALLLSLPRDPSIPWVFWNPRTGKPPVSVFYAWDTIRKRVGLSEVRLHDLRHTFASFLVNSGRSLYEVQALLGHHDPKVTMRYAHLSPAALVEAANVVERAVRRPQGEGGGNAPAAGGEG